MALFWSNTCLLQYKTLISEEDRWVGPHFTGLEVLQCLLWLIAVVLDFQNSAGGVRGHCLLFYMYVSISLQTFTLQIPLWTKQWGHLDGMFTYLYKTKKIDIPVSLSGWLVRNAPPIDTTALLVAQEQDMLWNNFLFVIFNDVCLVYSTNMNNLFAVNV